MLIVFSWLLGAGMIAGFYDIACVIVSVPISYMGSRPTASKPRWVGLGLVIMGLGSFVFLLPHFLVGFYEIQPEDGGAERSPSVNCNATQVSHDRLGLWLAHSMSEKLHFVRALDLFS